MMEEVEEEVYSSSLTAREGSKLDQGVVEELMNQTLGNENIVKTQYIQAQIHNLYLVFIFFAIVVIYCCYILNLRLNWEMFSQPLIDYCTCKCSTISR